MSVKWIWLLLLFPALTGASEHCADQLKGTCREICGPSEVAEAGAFIDCSDGQKCCVASVSGKNSAPLVKIILIDNYSFSPAEIKIGKGTEVVWKNSDGVDHTVTAADGSFDSGTLGPGASIKRGFTGPAHIPTTVKCTHPWQAVSWSNTWQGSSISDI